MLVWNGPFYKIPIEFPILKAVIRIVIDPIGRDCSHERFVYVDCAAGSHVLGRDLSRHGADTHH